MTHDACTCGSRGLHRGDCPAYPWPSLWREPSELFGPMDRADYERAMECINAHQLAQEAIASGKAFAMVGEKGIEPLTKEDVMQHPDPGRHYRLEIRRRITDEDIARGWVRVKVDPYRICRLSGIQGGPHEHATKKLLRGKAKGHSERELIREVRACLDRWEEMIAEDEEEARCR